MSDSKFLTAEFADATYRYLRPANSLFATNRGAVCACIVSWDYIPEKTYFSVCFIDSDAKKLAFNDCRVAVLCRLTARRLFRAAKLIADDKLPATKYQRANADELTTFVAEIIKIKQKGE